MRKLFFFIGAILVAIQFQAQNTFKRNAFYGEIMGNGLVLSVNYERQLSNKPGLGFHIGVGLGSNKPDFPIGVNYLFPLSEEKSFFEIGAGITLAERDLWSDTDNSQLKNNSYSPGFIPSIGYRHHSPKGLMWRLDYTTVFNKYRSEAAFFGFSIGWRI